MSGSSEMLDSPLPLTTRPLQGLLRLLGPLSSMCLIPNPPFRGLKAESLLEESDFLVQVFFLRSFPFSFFLDFLPLKRFNWISLLVDYIVHCIPFLSGIMKLNSPVFDGRILLSFFGGHFVALAARSVYSARFF